MSVLSPFAVQAKTPECTFHFTHLCGGLFRDTGLFDVGLSEKCVQLDVGRVHLPSQSSRFGFGVRLVKYAGVGHIDSNTGCCSDGFECFEIMC